MFIFEIKFFFEECTDGERRPLKAECEWYNLCLKGIFAPKRCPSTVRGQRQAFNPIINNCTNNVKLPVDGKCQSFKECLVIESVSPFGKWTEVSCGPGQHFDQESQKCIGQETSTCGKYFQDFILRKTCIFLSLFIRIIINIFIQFIFQKYDYIFR